MLCEHPAIFNRLREEVLEKLGPTDRPTFEVLKNMKYLRAVLNGKFTPLHFIVYLIALRFNLSSLPFRNFEIISSCVR